jgi:macrodomain Ter protein organizer (MatP/YcbG family)
VSFLDNKQKISLNIDAELWKKLRIKSLENGDTATNIIEKLIAEYIKKK